jgi:xylitol oxidase
VPRELRNWAGNHVYTATAVHFPASLDELRRIVAAADQVRALGSRHSFSTIADARELVALERLPGEVDIDRKGLTATVPAAMTYAEIADALNAAGCALPNMASLPHISIGGAVATATHGSGERTRNLATAVSGVELVTSSGDVVWIGDGDARFQGAVVGLGALGVVTRVQLALEPYYEVAQRVYEGLEWDALYEHLDEIYAAGNSVSGFHLFGERVEQVWVKRRMPADGWPSDLFGAVAADGPRHPVLGGDAVNCTEQLGVPGPWSERLPHFRSGFTPSSGEEIQSEAFVARANAGEALRALRELGDEVRPLLLTSELRAIRADELWLSPQHGRETFAIHFTWRREPAAVERAVGLIEAALAPFGVRSHWGKVTSLRAADALASYPRMADFRALREELDPRGVFVNDWLRAHVLEPA